ncbi:MAG: glycosyltransferase family 4 protein [Halioglobus sp.]
MITYFFSQFCLFVRLLLTKGISRNATVYVNTLLPFGAALYGRITGRRVVYHLHEVSISPAPLRWFLVAVARCSASDLIYVSDFHRNCLPIGTVPSHTICNALDTAFLARAETSCYQQNREGFFTILMLASLRDYKGIPEFLALASSLHKRPDIRFELVCNEDGNAISRYFSGQPVPSNVAIHPRTSDTAPYYERSSLVLNLSRPDEWVETFGLTLLEAMAFGVPVIAPPVGGPAEIVSDGVEGYLVSSYEVERISELIVELADDEAKVLRLSRNAKMRAADFTPQQFESQLREVIGD